MKSIYFLHLGFFESIYSPLNYEKNVFIKVILCPIFVFTVMPTVSDTIGEDNG